MSRRVWAATAIVALVVAGGAAVWYLNPTGERAFALTCEEAIKSRLKAPSTYDRIRASSIVRTQATLSEYMGEETEEKRQWRQEDQPTDQYFKDMRTGMSAKFKAGDYDLVRMDIEYDAANGFGAPIRSRARCEVIVPAGGPAAIPPFETPRIDGFDQLDWTMFNLWKQERDG